nr:MAG TPA: hypothetical protein [Caudoviricetes sp.]
MLFGIHSITIHQYSILITIKAYRLKMMEVIVISMLIRLSL